MKTMWLLPLLLISAACAQESYVISGTLTGSDGKPMKLAHVSVSKPYTATEEIRVDPDGSFSVSLEGRGAYSLSARGVSHLPADFDFCIAHPCTLRVAIRLKPHEFAQKSGGLSLIGNFNRFDFHEGTIPMKSRRDGAWEAVVKTDSAVVRYQIIGMTEEKRSVNGTQAEYFESDGEGDYISVVTPKAGRAAIVFDPKLLPKAGTKATAAFEDGLNAAIQDYHATVRNIDVMKKALRSSGKMTLAKHAAFRSVEDSICHSLESMAEKAPDTLIGPCRRIQSLDWRLRTRDEEDSAALDAALSIPASSAAWATYLWVYSRFADYEYETRRDSSMTEAFLSSDHSMYDKARLLLEVMMAAKERKDTARIRTLFSSLVTDFPVNELVFTAKIYFNPDSKTAPGKYCPKFSLSLLEDSTRFVTDESLRGKVVILHFWNPEYSFMIPELESMYEMYAGSGLKILSFALGAGLEQIAEYRRTISPMPWLHARTSQDGWDKDVMNTFDVVGAPFIILLDRQGKVIMSGLAYMLLETLALEVRAAVLNPE